jgi:hypothetical protein
LGGLDINQNTSPEAPFSVCGLPQCGAANPGCRRLSAGAWSFYIFRQLCFDPLSEQATCAASI